MLPAFHALLAAACAPCAVDCLQRLQCPVLGAASESCPREAAARKVKDLRSKLCLAVVATAGGCGFDGASVMIEVLRGGRREAWQAGAE